MAKKRNFSIIFLIIFYSLIAFLILDLFILTEKSMLLNVKENEKINENKEYLQYIYSDVKNEKNKNMQWKYIIEGYDFSVLRKVKYYNGKIYAFGSVKIENTEYPLMLILNYDGKKILENILYKFPNYRILSVDFSDNFIYYVGYIHSNSDTHPFIMKTDLWGNIIWVNLYSDKSGVFNNIAVENYGYIFSVGYIWKGKNKEGYVKIIDENRNEIFEKSYGWFGNEEFLRVLITEKYLYALGKSDSNPESKNDILILRQNIFNYSDYALKRIGKSKVQNNLQYAVLNEENKKIYFFGYKKIMEQGLGVPFFGIFDISNQEYKEYNYTIERGAVLKEAIMEGDNFYIVGYALKGGGNFDGLILNLEEKGTIHHLFLYDEALDDRLLSVDEASGGSLICVGYIKKDKEVKGYIINVLLK